MLNPSFYKKKQIEREVFLKPIKESSKNKVWKLNTAVYGLCDELRAWYFSAKEELINTGVNKSRYNDTIYLCHNDRLLQNVLLSHVENVFCAGTEWFQNNVVNVIKKKLSIKEETRALRYLSLNIIQKNI